ncbi:hypothetical protein PACILC2_57440 [Paenibacillus cisolokensis]|uniref:Uncharacterized protein n=1 Tax=Paenibacillus cisolokensis TaxID=1658519 RepID=A0ABQ4NG38_9BACL|nr:hypothetical protein [Paenibacillus cisolokensis]GIQ67176.1 hypothetical protein PACILC2_57440 [Paenibacillus cisolokensis]
MYKRYYIPKKANKKDTISWAKINRLRIPYEQLTAEQKQVHDNMTAIQQLIKENKNILDRATLYKLNMIVANLKYKLGIMCQSPNVGRSNNGSVKRFDTDEHQEYLVNAILDNLDYTNPVHIKALIENYNDLYNKYRNEPDSPIYTILNEFATHVHNVNLSDNHRLILLAFMHKSSDKKRLLNFWDQLVGQLKK